MSASTVKTGQKPHTPEAAATRLAQLGAHLRSCRVLRQMTHEEVAAAAGFSRQTLSRIEKGDPSVAIGQVVRYASLVGIDAFSAPAGDAQVHNRQRVRRRPVVASS